MKKLAILFTLFVLLAHPGAPWISRVFAAVNCGWTVGSKNGIPINGAALCYSGFTTAQSLINTKVQFQCTSNCGRFNPGPTQEKATSAFEKNPPQDADGTYFTCAGGEGGKLDPSIYDAVRWKIDAASLACGTIGLAEWLVPLPITGAKVAKIVLKGTVDAITVAPCLAAVNNYHPTLQGRVVDQNGNVLCKNDLTINVDTSGLITATGENPGGLGKGTVLQGSGGGLQFCTTNGSQGIQTALGCISTDPSKFIGSLLTIGIGLAGGIAFLLILFGGFQILTSAGNPEQLNAGKELVSSAIAGLLLIIFSIFILKVIGVNILGIPGFL